LQGLRNRLYKSGVKVLTIKPGTVDTPMTAHLKKGLLFASVESVGKQIYDIILKGKEVSYVPGYWRGIMTVIRTIPEPVFKRLKL
jgi:decaprenylphospho-beta-D-erythro-pentofuranosid-2-ulose 2-reductase